MKSRFLSLAGGVAVCALAMPAFADDARDALVRSEQAQHAAPVCRMTIKTKEADASKSTVLVVETVNPNQMHVRQEQGGKVIMEMFTDGRRTMIRRGADGPIVPAPASVGATIASVQRSVSMQALAETAKDVKVVGHDIVKGQTATIYSFTTDTMGVHAVSKIWISDRDALPLKAEGDSTGTPNVGAAVSGGKTSRHSEITFDYDPSVAFVVPAAA